MSYVIQGVLLSVPEATEDLVAMKRLWVHEVLRVYADRLVDDADRLWVGNMLKVVLKQKLFVDMDKILARLMDPGVKTVSIITFFLLQAHWKLVFIFHSIRFGRLKRFLDLADIK